MKALVKNGTILLILLFSENSCFTVYNFDKLTYYKKHGENLPLKTNGCYFCKFPNNDTIAKYVFLYEDGTFLYWGVYSISEFLKSPYKSYSDPKSTENQWGFYCYENEILKIQHFYFDVKEFYINYEYREYWAKVTNDSTFTMFKYLDNQSNTKMNEIYHFKQLDFKPDSNNWLKNNKRLSRKMN